MRNRRKKFFEVHREEIMIHKEAKKPFGELGVKRILNVKQLNAEYARLMEEKIQTSTEYWKARDEVREYIIIKENIASMRRNERKMELIGMRKCRCSMPVFCVADKIPPCCAVIEGRSLNKYKKTPVKCYMQVCKPQIESREVYRWVQKTV